MIKTRIIGTGSYLPEKILSNKDLEKMMDTTDEWIITRTGIKERRIVAKDERTSDLATKAAINALESAQITPEDLDIIIVATITPDMFFPSTACFVQDKLNARKSFAFDISAACSGFIYGLSVANEFLKNSPSKKILLIGAETLSKIVDWKDRNTGVLFGDGAGAVVLEGYKGKNGIIATNLYSDGSFWELLNVPGGGSANPISMEIIEKRLHFIKMQGNGVFKIAVKSLGDAAIEILKNNNINNIDILIPHQANIRIIQAIAKRIGISMDKVYLNIDKYGNTSSASIPIALDEANREGRLKEGDIVLLEAFGGGLTWGSALLRW
jgi:3-oxoacyl-[acyl-carrier-protein] synthase-3